MNRSTFRRRNFGSSLIEWVRGIVPGNTLRRKASAAGTAAGRLGVFEPLEPRQLLTALWANVPEASSYSLVYEKDIPVTSPGWNSGPVAYEVDNAASIAQPFDRIAYYWELEKPGGGTDWVYVSADSFTSDLGKIGIPNTNSGAFFQQYLSDMSVQSNVSGIISGTGIGTGNIEFWPSNYGRGNSAGIPNASGSVFDFGDGGANTNAGHGSMQIHNYGAQQTLFGYSAWGSVRTSELGLGNQVGGSGNPDWTFNTSNISNYTKRTLQVLVQQVAPEPPAPAPAALVANAPELANYRLVYQKDLPDSVTYNTTGVTYDQDLSSTVSVGSFDRVAYYLQLDTDFVEVSFDSAGFTDDATKTGIPDTASGENYQQYVANMNVTSNVPGVFTGTGITTGNVEFWPNNYQGQNSGQNTGVPPALNVPGASESAFDFGDRQSVGGYGSMQIHNYGASQTVFAYNRWGNSSGNSDLGIGNRPSDSNTDWTFAQNAQTYGTKSLYVLVRPESLISGTGAGDTIVLSTSGGSYQIVLNGGAPVIVSGTDPLEIQGLDGNDTLTLDFSGGNPIPTGGLTFVGGDPTIAPGDRLEIINAAGANSIGDLTHTFYNGNAGRIDIDGRTVDYFGLEPVDMTGSTVGNLVLNLAAGLNDQAVLEDDGTPGNGISRIRSINGTFETTTFANPTASLTINAQGGDAVSLAPLDSGFATPAVSLNGIDADNTYTQTAAGVLPNSAALTVNGSATFDVGGFDTTVGSLSGDGTVSFDAATLSTGGNNGDTTFDGLLRGTGGNLVKEGTSRFTLTNANSYDGTTTINLGELRVTNASALGSTAGGTSVTGGNAALEVDSSSPLDFSEPLTIAGDGIGATGALRATGASGSHTWNVPITVTGSTRIQADGGRSWTLTGGVSSPANQWLRFTVGFV